MDSETYRVKQVRAKYADNGAGVPPYGTQYWQGLTLSEVKRSGEIT